MAIPDVSLSFRASEETRRQLSDLMEMFERDRSWILRKAVAVFWLIVFDLTKLEEYIHDWQEFHRSKSQHRVSRQLKLVFNEPNPPFFPRIWYSKPEVSE